jgi:hypothetical protein
MNILSTSNDYNPNYVARIVTLEQLAPHPQADRLQLATVCGSVVITGLNAQVGDTYVYFPVECVINRKFLAWSNSFSDPELNQDQKEKGFFHKSGRVRMTRLRGIYSNGYIIPLAELQRFVKEVYGKVLDGAKKNDTFDTICDELFVWKYVVPIKEVQVPGVKTKGKIKKFNRVVPGQFDFHPDTKNLRQEIGEVDPEDYISITNKYHGSCFEVANTLVYQELNWFQKFLVKVGINIPDKKYGRLYASRTVIKDAKTNPEVGAGWYGTDIWGIVAERAFPKLDKGVRITGEVIGYTPTGKMIQPGYDYGVPENELDFLVFKVDIVNPDGETWTLSHQQTVDYCQKKGFRIPECYYYGKAKDLFPELDTTHHWHDNFLQKLEETFLGKKELTNKDKTLPAEGVILRKEVPLGWKVLKLKDLEFLGVETKQLDKGEVGVEDTQDTENL